MNDQSLQDSHFNPTRSQSNQLADLRSPTKMHSSLFSLPLLLLPLLSQATPLPSTLIVSVFEASTGNLLGTLNGRGNFSSPGPSYPFRSYPVSVGSDVTYLATGTGLPGCSTSTGVLNCGNGQEGSRFIVSLMSSMGLLWLLMFWHRVSMGKLLLRVRLGLGLLMR